MKTVIEFAHDLLKDNITKDDIALDMTLGNGFDTLFLVQNCKFVYGFDIQKEACLKTAERLQGFKNFELINDSHQKFLEYVNIPYKGVIFNLGYLPKGNKNIVTQAKTTLETLQLVLDNIMIDGICVLVVYPGHPEGNRESIVLEDYLKKLNQKNYDVIKYEFINQINYPPYLLAIRRKK